MSSRPPNRKKKRAAMLPPEAYDAPIPIQMIDGVMVGKGASITIQGTNRGTTAAGNVQRVLGFQELTVEGLDRLTRAPDQTVKVETLGPVTRFGTPTLESPPPPPRLPSMDRLRRIADFLPLASRKQMKALVGDYFASARELQAEGRQFAAYWNIAMAWWFSGCIFAGAPVGAVLKFFVRTFKG